MNLLFVSLGCDKNLVDSEHMLSLLAKDGFTLVEEESEADVIIVNTCCFIHDAMEESIQTLIDLGRYKTEGKCKVLLAAGCLAQRHADDIRRELPEVDGVIGTNGYDTIVKAVQTALSGKRPENLPGLSGLPQTGSGRILTTGGHYAYLKIAEGCDKHCTYCVIPSIRGNYRSLPMEELLAEARQLAADGVRELILVAQETTLYGTDLHGKKSLPRLLEELNAIDGIAWIRLLYCYPEEIDDALIDAILANDKVCHYIDMPIQHCNDEILRRMGRRTDKRQLEQVIDRLRERIPDIALRTTLICGFPGETDEAHQELVQFVRSQQFDRLGAFCYSQEEGTPAAAMPRQIDEEVKQQRYEAIMEAQQSVSAEKNRRRIGETETVFIEGRVADEDGVYVGRTYRDAPDVDGYLFLESPYDLMSGRFVRAIVTDAQEYDLIGELIDESTK